MIYAILHWPEKSSAGASVAAFVIVKGIRAIVSMLDQMIILVLSDNFRAHLKN